MLRTVVVGGGIAGLSAGIALRRAGHVVNIYEQSDMKHEVGAAINVPPNASRFLTSWGLDPKLSRFVKARALAWWDPFTANVTATMSYEEKAARSGGAELWLAHRVDLHGALKHIATDPAGPGIPVTVHPGSRVVGYEPRVPSITLASGEVIGGDVVIGADGVHSLASETVLGYKNSPVAPSHYNYCYRFLIPVSTLQADPETRSWNADIEGKTRIFADNENRRRLVAYACRDNTIHNFVGLFYDEASTYSAKKEDYLASVDKAEVMERFAGYHPSILAVIKLVPPSPPPGSSYARRRQFPGLLPPQQGHRHHEVAVVIQTTDPRMEEGQADQAQAGAQAMEDGVALGIVLRGVSTAEEIEERLELYQKIRRNRASVIQILSSVGADQSHLVYEDLKEFLAEEDIPTNPSEITDFSFGYDVVKASLEAVRQLRGTSIPPPDGGINGAAADRHANNLVDSPQLTAVVH
ncbi:hypothetical protein DL766_006813 [Monosporascus sp. MC13-8B]|uniref:FAD-binding domain-containing protein n=1 Tax=Monosporascus cannonballus TaxID=155416 RepID=A0ABY0H7G7_9PEZI|nr:hypothetical protein DL762_006173 [Monosporascus cannonballus]RYO90980.1 hypothetical protein DL763_005151 [Monosporascus cannonballus]RYP26140.1 hypothetical protein DL766_006813 [Monosporascus sp. MC13-8B]